MPVAQSFRSNWQAQLASLGSGADVAIAEPESAELTGAELKGGNRPQLGADDVSEQPSLGRSAPRQQAGQLLPARGVLGESLGGSQPAGPGLPGSGGPSICVLAGVGSTRVVVPAHEQDAGKAATSKPGDSRPVETPHRAVKGESEKASIAASPEPIAAAVVISSIGSAIQATPSPAVNPTQTARKPVQAELASASPGAIALNSFNDVSPWTSLAAGSKSGVSGAANHLGTVAQLPTVPSWAETGSQTPPVSGNPVLNRSVEPAQAFDDRRIDPDTRKGAFEEPKPTAVEGNRTAHEVDAPTREPVGTTAPVEDSPPAAQTSQPAQMRALPVTGNGAGQASIATTGAPTGTGMDNRIEVNAQSNPSPGPLPVSTSGPVQVPAQSSPIQALPMVNPAPEAGIKSGVRGAATGIAGAGHVIAAQTASAGVANAAGWVRDPTGIPQPQAGISDLSSKGRVEPALREPFAALDAEPAPAALAWTHASARQAEAGFEDPVLGWVGVRGELSGGGVHAALVPGSAEAAEQLGRQMDGLHTYLAEQRTPVESLVMSAPSGGGANTGAGGGLGHAAQHEMGQGAGQNAREHAAREVESRTTSSSSGADRAADPPASIAPIGSDVMARSGGGSRISLVA